MLYTDDRNILNHLYDGLFGIERETLRITPDGFLAQTPHPFKNDNHIVRDFSENQVEINTDPLPSIDAVFDQLTYFDTKINNTLKTLPQPELLWPFSNPPYIRDWRDIPVAHFEGQEAYKTKYRQYLSKRYGRYKMAFSGIHVNFSFDEELLKKNYAIFKQRHANNTTFSSIDPASLNTSSSAKYLNDSNSSSDLSFSVDSSSLTNQAHSINTINSFEEYKDQFYVTVAQGAVVYGWILTALTAASPVADSSFVEKNKLGQDVFRGLSTIRCSELGYWNYFTPVLDYKNYKAYEQSIDRYVCSGLIKGTNELYYPVRIKPNDTQNSKLHLSGNVSHIELRMFDLNPLYPQLVNPDDVLFAQLLLIWIAANTPGKQPLNLLSECDQVQSTQNFKYASHYDLKTVTIGLPDKSIGNAVSIGKKILNSIKDFYNSIKAPQHVLKCIDFQLSKLETTENRYAYKIRKQFSNTFVHKGLLLAKKRTEQIV